MNEIELALIEDIVKYTRDPLGFVNYAFPWREGELADYHGPREWQADILATIGEHLRNPKTRFTPLRIAVSSGHGIGKSAEIAMIINWAMSTCEDCKVVITANTEPQLRTKTWPEVSKWTRLAINTHWWNLTETAITVRSKKNEKTWRTDRVTWSENNTEAFAGLHNVGKRIVLIFDEASAIADKVWEVAEGALTDENTEIIWLAFGNPTQNTGRFAECFGKFKHRWITRQIDSRTVEGTNKAEIENWAKDYGEDSDFFRVRVRGEFPRAGSDQFIPSDVVELARKAKVEIAGNLPKILSMDVARFGDDQTVIGKRQGRKFEILGKYRGLDIVQSASKMREFIDREKPDMSVIDGDGLGAGVVDTLRHWGYTKIHEFHGGHSPSDPQQYYNKRAEVWGEMRDWLSNAQIPDSAELAQDLTGPKYFTAKGKTQHGSIVIESKEDMKRRGLASPDMADCLAMSFGVKIIAKPQPKAPPARVGVWS